VNLAGPNIVNLTAIENAAFVADLLSKTKKSGLAWQRVAPNLFTVQIYDHCTNSNWTFYVGKNNANNTALSYVYYIEVLLNSTLNLYTDSRQTSFVAQLFHTIELVMASPNGLRIDRAIDFISKVPSNPSSDVTYFKSCGGINVGGDAKIMAIYNPQNIMAGVSCGGSAIVKVTRFGNSICESMSAFAASGKVQHNAKTKFETQTSLVANGSVS
jgi:hypothetical protein